ncbi:MAG: glycosyltransferase family 2 protein, partial [Brevibacterium aurantiacum]|uniref:glycosyltransferase family 2 protein n=1 Tax=Brevibacterium aurantiacum TaxID=273384 RepID=UPI003F9163C0
MTARSASCRAKSRRSTHCARSASELTRQPPRRGYPLAEVAFYCQRPPDRPARRISVTKTDLSIIIPAKNGAPYLPTMFGSLLQQGDIWQRSQLIFVNDGSTDDTPRVLDE